MKTLLISGLKLPKKIQKKFKKHQNDSIVSTKDSHINNQHFLLSEAAFDLEYKSSDEGFNYFEQESTIWPLRPCVK